MNDLNAARQNIDECDQEIIKLLAKRFNLVKQIKQIKTQNNLPALDKNRWDRVRNKIEEISARENLDPNGIGEIYEQIHSYTLKYIYDD